jgi:retron-type reverse transcriptase
MKRLGGIWNELTSFENLLLAYNKAKRGKMKRLQVGRFTFSLEGELLRLQSELQKGTYRPGKFQQFQIYDRKPRLISAAPFRDRGVHHAVMNLIEPYIDQRLYEHSYACRKEKGVHKAVQTYQQWANRYAYALNVDVMKYFPSIDHEILKTKIARYIKDKKALALMSTIVDHSPKYENDITLFEGDDLITGMQRKRGLPIGNLTSQIFANIYLTELDFFMKQQCKVPAYLRYVDDCVLLADSKQQLRECHHAMQDFLQQERLLLHPKKTKLQPTQQPLNLLGYRVSPHKIRLGNSSGYRYRRRLRGLAKAFKRDDVSLREVSQSIAAWKGHAQHADTTQLRKAIFSGIIFTKGSTSIPFSSSLARRGLEQQTKQHPFCQPQQEQS